MFIPQCHRLRTNRLINHPYDRYSSRTEAFPKSHLNKFADLVTDQADEHFPSIKRHPHISIQIKKYTPDSLKTLTIFKFIKTNKKEALFGKFSRRNLS
jgi:hypothetical protein